MLTSLGLIFLIGLLLGEVARRLGLPRIVGMLLAGVLLGPYGLGLLDDSILGISAELREMALVIILLKAGLSLDLRDLKRVGRPALLLSFVPACCEILGYTLLAPGLFAISRTEAAVLGAVMSAVSPAVVVPRMTQLMEERRGTREGIPQMILAGASLDDVFVIVLFTTFTGMAQGHAGEAAALLDVPVSVVLGVLLGAGAGWLLVKLFARTNPRMPVRAVILLAASFLALAAEDLLKGKVALSGLLAIMGMACLLREKAPAGETSQLTEIFGKLWTGAEVLLFVLVGAVVPVGYALDAGPKALLLILLALCIRSAGVALCLLKTPLNRKERLFCVVAYLPKATVQAAIGGIPLALGLPCGQLVLSVAVVGILLTAPLGALGIDRLSGRLLQEEGKKSGS